MTSLLLAHKFKATKGKGVVRIYHKLAMHSALATLSGSRADLAWCRFHAAGTLEARDEMMRKIAVDGISPENV